MLERAQWLERHQGQLTAMSNTQCHTKLYYRLLLLEFGVQLCQFFRRMAWLLLPEQ
jgi:hypothetical protein